MTLIRKNQPKVSITILNWNGLKDTIECLESIKKISYTNYDVVVVDQGSKGNDAQVLEERFGNYIHLVKNDRNYGSGGGINIAMKYALDNCNPDYILLLDNDTITDRNFLDELVEVISRDGNIGAVVAVIYSYDEPDQIQQSLTGYINFWIGDVMGMDWLTRFFGVPPIKDNLPREIKQPGFWCILFRRECVENVGLMDTTYFMMWDSADYCERIRRAGYRFVYAPKAKIWHKWRTSTKIDGKAQYYLLRNRFKFMKKYATRMQNISFLVFFFTVHFWLATAYYLIWSRHPRILLNFYKGVKDGLSLFYLRHRTNA